MPRRHLLFAVALATFTWFSAVCAEGTVPTGFVVIVVAGPEVVQEPIDLTFAPDGSAWVTGLATRLVTEPEPSVTTTE